jgi:hypothetical protein
MATTASMSQRLGTLVITGDANGDDIVVGRSASGDLLVDGGATRIKGGKATVANTTLVTVQGSAADDRVVVDLSSGAMPRVEVAGGGGLDTVLVAGGAASETFDLSSAGGMLNVAVVSQAGLQAALGTSGVETLVLQPGAGGDEVFVGDLTGSGVARVEVQFGNDGAADVLAIAGRAVADALVLAVSGDVATVDGASVAVQASGFEAADRFFVDAGDGADRIDARGIVQRADMLGGAGGDTLLGGGGDDALQAQDGHDVVAGGGGADLVSLADGDDRALWAAGDGSDNVSGGAGSDRLEAAGTTAADVFDVSALAVGGQLALGGAQVAFNGVETVRIDAGGGADRITVGHLTGTGVTRVEIDLGGGDQLADRVLVAGLVGGAVVQGDARIYSTTAGVQIVVTGFEPSLDTVTLLG